MMRHLARHVVHLSSRVPASAWVVGVIVGVIVAGALLSGLSDGSDDDEDRAEPANDTIALSTTTTRVTTDLPPTTTTTTAPPTTAPPPAPSAIPGLTVDDLQSDLTDQGWACGPAVQQSSPGYVIWACYEPPGSPWLGMTATPAGDVVFVQVLATMSSEYHWLEYIAALPWDGAEAEAARSWVHLTISGASGALGLDIYQTSFGGVPYEIGGSTGMPSLLIGTEPP